MLMPDTQHLTADELDLLLVGTPAPRATLHIETCDSCRTMSRLDREVVGSLARLPMLEPSEGFADRVMRQVIVSSRAPPVGASSRGRFWAVAW